MDGYTFADIAARALAFVVVVYAGWLVIKVIGWLWRTVTSVRATDVARTAGAVSARVEQKASSMASAFKDGRNQR